MSRLIAVLLTCASSMSIAQSARARDFGTCCGDTIRWFHDGTFKLLPVSFPQGSAFKARFEEAAAAYNDVTGSSFDWTVTMDNDNSRTERGDGTEVGFFGTAPDWGVLGETLIKWGACVWPACDEEISETDIKFYTTDRNGAAFPWDTGIPAGAYFQRMPVGVADPNLDPGYSAAEPLYFAVVASHEIGHASGLAHSSNGAARMESHYPNGGWFHRGSARVTPLTGEQSELRRIYTTSGSSADVYAISWQDIPYSSDPEGGVDSWPITAQESATDSDPWRYPFNHTTTLGNDDAAARPGHVVTVRLCLGNLGNAPAPISGLEFFLTADQNVASSDARAAEGWLSDYTVPANANWCANFFFTVPSVVPGWYFVGAWLNRGSATGTGNSNNVTILNRRLRVVN